MITRLRHQPAVLRCTPLSLAPDEPVDGVDVIEQILKTILYPRIPDYLPSDANGKYPIPTADSIRLPHRPGKILFEDISLAYTCTDSIKALGIQVQVIRMEIPLQPFLRMFSESLVKLGIAQATKMTLSPGFNDIANVPPSVYRTFLLAAREFAQANPWVTIPDKQAFRIRFSEAGEGPASDEPLVAWANINGQGEFRNRFIQIEKMGKNPDSLPYNHTLSIYFKRYDLEMALMKGTYLQQLKEEHINSGKDQSTPIAVDFEKMPAAEANPYDVICAYCKKTAFEGTGDSTTPASTTEESNETPLLSRAMTLSTSAINRFSRCVRCRDVYYCNEVCQKAHWKEHKTYCDANKISEMIKVPTPGKAFGYNAVREIRIAFQRPFDVPCTDIEVMEKLNILPDHRDNYPLIMVLKNGSTYPPTPAEIGWALRALSAVLSFWRARPDAIQDLRPMQYEHTVSLTRTVYPLGNGLQKKSNKNSESNTDKKERLTANDVEAEYNKDIPWYEMFLDSASCHVRTDPILSRQEAKDLAEEIADITKNKFDKAVIKPGVYVPTATSLPPKDYVDFVDDKDNKDTDDDKDTSTNAKSEAKSESKKNK